MKISHDMNLNDLAEWAGAADLETYKLAHVRMRLCSMGWKDTADIPEDAWLHILGEVSKPMPVYAVDADPETGAWLFEPVITGESSTFLDWCRREDTVDAHFDHYDADGETRLIRADYAPDA